MFKLEIVHTINILTFELVIKKRNQGRLKNTFLDQIDNPMTNYF